MLLTGSRAELLLEQSPACQWTLDARGTFEQIYGNPAPLFGRQAAELAGRRLKEVFPPETAIIWQSRVGRAIEGETLVLRERRGATAWFVCVFPILQNGVARLAGGLAHEITAFAAAEQELRNTVHGALKAQEFERATLARFLHDAVGQNLTALGLQLDLVRMDLDAQPPLASRIDEAQKLLEAVMQEVREASYTLNPAMVERAGLRAALDRLEPRFRERFTGVLRINCDPSIKLEPSIAIALYHIAQEAVENAVQHAACSLVEIAVKSTRTGAWLEVKDNGRGFDPADLLNGNRGLGLLSMEHHAAQAGLELSIKSSRAAGTTVRASGPGRMERSG